MKLRLDLKLSQKLIMTPQLQQAIKLLQLSRLELQQSLSQHLLENPLLDEVQAEAEDAESATAEGKAEESPAAAGQEQPEEGGTREERGAPEESTASGWEEYFGSDRRIGDSEGASSSQDEFPSYEQTLAKATSLEEHLLWQLSLSGLSDRGKALGRLIIGNLDDDGYLRITLAEVIAGTDFTESEAESALRDIQTFDPTGVGARDLSECLLLQLGHLGRNPIGSLGARPGALKGSIVEGVILHHLKDLEKKTICQNCQGAGCDG
jgi:RNA polymerase sigma-54 factor